MFKKQNGFIIYLLNNDLTEEMQLEAVKQDGHVLPYSSDKLRNDREIVLESVKYNSWTLYYASKELKSNKNFMLKLAKQDKNLVIYADKSIRDELIYKLYPKKKLN